MKLRKDGSNKGLKKSEQTELKCKIRTMVEDGYEDEEIMLALKLQPHVFQHHRNRVAEETLKTFLDGGSIGVLQRYVMFCQEDLKELDEAMVEAAKKKRTASASVQAARLKRNIHNSIVKMACDFGLIPKRTREVTIEGQLFVQT